MRVCVALVIACLLGNIGYAQSKELRFDVVAIKLLGPGEGPPPFSGELIHPGGELRDPGTTLRALIDMAYDVDDLGVKIVGLPKWAEAAVYTIRAKAGPEYQADISKKQNEENVKAMIRSMLAGRFQLRLHQEERKAEVLILQSKNGGAKLSPVAAPVPPEKEGRLGMRLSDRNGFIRGKKITIAQMAKLLTLDLKQRVEDRTGLAGFYDFDEMWETTDRQGDSGPANKLGQEGLAQLASVLDQNLGLVLRSETMAAPFWVVDQVEMPGEN